MPCDTTGGLRLRQDLSGSNQYEKGRDTLIGSAGVTFSPLTSPLSPVTPPSSRSPPPPLALLALGGTQEPLRPPGKVTAASAHMF